MPDGSELERSRAFARAQVGRLLAIDVEPAALFELAFEELGAARAARCLKLVRRGRLTRRAPATAHVAALVVGTRTLGEAWWAATGDAVAAQPDGVVLETLARQISDGCADARWGPPVGFVDLGDPRTEDRIDVPPGAVAGDSFVAACDPGCRVAVEIVERAGGLGSVLGDLYYDDAAEIEWAWALAADLGPIRLPGEVAGTPGDPWAAQLDARAATRLRAWAGEHEADEQRIGGVWRTREDLWEAYHRLGLPYERDAAWHGFELVCRAAVDGDPDELSYALARLGMS